MVLPTKIRTSRYSTDYSPILVRVLDNCMHKAGIVHCCDDRCKVILEPPSVVHSKQTRLGGTFYVLNRAFGYPPQISVTIINQLDRFHPTSIPSPPTPHWPKATYHMSRYSYVRFTENTMYFSLALNSGLFSVKMYFSMIRTLEYEKTIQKIPYWKINDIV